MKFRAGARLALAAACGGVLLHCVGSDPDPITPEKEGGAPIVSLPDTGSGNQNEGGPGVVDAGPPDAEGKFVSSLVFASGSAITRLVVDPAGNRFFVVPYGSMELGGTTFTSGQGFVSNQDFAVAKVAPNGAVLWATLVKGSKVETPIALTLDGAGNVFVLGAFESANAQVGDSVVPLGTAKSSLFIARLEPDGRVKWVKPLSLEKGPAGEGAQAYFGGELRATAKGIAFACNFRGALNTEDAGFATSGAVVGFIDPESGATTASVPLFSTFTNDPPRSFDGVSVNALDVDDASNLYLVGRTNLAATYFGTMQIPQSLGAEATGSAFAMRVDPSLTSYSWFGLFDGASSSVVISDVRVDVAGQAVYVLGAYSGTPDFGGGPVAKSQLGDLFALKLAMNSGALQWSAVMGGPSDDSPGAIDIDPWGRPLLSGRIQNADNTTIGSVHLPPGNVLLVTKLDPATGKHLYLAAQTSTGSGGVGVASDVVGLPNGNALVAGSFNGTMVLEAPRTADGGANAAFIVEMTP